MTDTGEWGRCLQDSKTLIPNMWKIRVALWHRQVIPTAVCKKKKIMQHQCAVLISGWSYHLPNIHPITINWSYTCSGKRDLFVGSIVYQLSFLLDSCSLVLKAMKSGRNEERSPPNVTIYVAFTSGKGLLSSFIKNWTCLELTTTTVWFWWSIFFLQLLHHCPSN